MRWPAVKLACARKLGPAMGAMRAGNWNKRAFMKPTASLAEQILGIAGYDRIGRQLSALAAPLVKRVIVDDPFVTGVPGLASFEELLSDSDFISLHCPLT
jgi:phosphoglycerate dehydrogenase-like enzyme